MIVIQAIYALLLFWMAWDDAEAIKKDLPVHHGMNGAAHVLMWCFGALVIGWWAFVLPFFGRLVFDVTLNLLRQKNWDYLSPDVMAGNPTASKTDVLEYRVFGNARTPKILYAAIIITVNIIYYAH